MRDAPIRPAGKTPHSNDETEITLGSEQELKEWMFDYMKGNYLGNDAVKQVTPDYALGYQAFLERILLDVAAQDDVNHDDGLTALALEWIDSGQKPDVKTRATAAPRLHALPIPGRRLQGSIVERNPGSPTGGGTPRIGSRFAMSLFFCIFAGPTNA
ncbi:hypothetical protein B5E60_04025 [Alistipes sp. An116]|uniref:hypothetical protein n=1 Tax=Alistipes sp. An116 TaxID=1965546 RepID=UPI000B38DAC8|nr:hypothetical protein [Alistipes sp. An116]OUQ54086.1 hypothetical protein B5E60_04025 [Alistipes sp. An116]